MQPVIEIQTAAAAASDSFLDKFHFFRSTIDGKEH